MALHEKFGFEKAAHFREVGFKFGQWIDVGHWQKDLAPRTAQPAEPLPFEPLFSPAP